MWNAINRLVHGNKKPYTRITSRMYAVIKTQFSKQMSEAMMGKFAGENHYLFGKHLSEETKRKMSKSLSGNKNPMFGTHHSEETRKKLAEAKRGLHWYNDGTQDVRAKECPPGFKPGRMRIRGKPLSAEAKAKLSKARKGTHLSDETKKKLSKAFKGKPRPVETIRKMSESLKGLHWYTDGKKTIKAKECPVGFTEGRI